MFVALLSFLYVPCALSDTEGFRQWAIEFEFDIFEFRLLEHAEDSTRGRGKEMSNKFGLAMHHSTCRSYITSENKNRL